MPCSKAGTVQDNPSNNCSSSIENSLPWPLCGIDELTAWLQNFHAWPVVPAGAGHQSTSSPHRTQSRASEHAVQTRPIHAIRFDQAGYGKFFMRHLQTKLSLLECNACLPQWQVERQGCNTRRRRTHGCASLLGWGWQFICERLVLRHSLQIAHRQSKRYTSN